MRFQVPSLFVGEWLQCTVLHVCGWLTKVLARCVGVVVLLGDEGDGTYEQCSTLGWLV